MTTTKRKKRKRTKRCYWAAAAVLCLILLAVMMPARAAEKQTTYKAETADGVNVTVTADENALPDGAKLSVKKIDSDDKQFNDVAQKVLTEKNVTGLLAYDIGFVKDGKEVEPNGKVNVDMAWDKAAALSQSDDADISIFHLKENDKGKIVKVDDLTDKDSTTIKQHKSAVESVKFQTDSLSPFTITWTTDKPNDAGEDQTYRIASVTIRYVDENGLTVNTEDPFTEDEMKQWSQKDGGIVDVSDWANKADGTSRVTGYTYDHAALRSRDGQTVTGLKANKSTEKLKVRTDYDTTTQQYIYKNVDNVTVYRLYYTTDKKVDKENPEANKWTLFEDYGTDTYANNSFVYLVYNHVQKPVTVHFLDTSGNAIKDDDGNDLTKVIDAADHTSEYDLVTFAKANIPSGYSFSDSNMNSDTAGTNKIILKDSNGSVTIGSVKGTYYRYLKYEDNTVKLARGDKNYTGASDPVDIYITFTSPQNIKFHHVDTTGTRLAADTTQTLPDRTTWDGYSNALNSNDSHYHVNNIGTYSGSYIGYFGDAGYSNTKDGTTLNGIYYKHDADGTWHTGLGITTNSVTREINDKNNQPALLNDVYQTYTGYKGVVIHHVNESGDKVADDTYAAVQSGKSLTAEDKAPEIDGYSYKEAHIGKADGSTFTTIDYKQNGDNWTSTVKKDDETVNTDDNPVNDVYLVYNKDVKKTADITLHYKYVNKSGSYSDAYHGNNSNDTTETITVESGKRTYLVSDPTQNGAYVDTIYNNNVWRKPVEGEGGDKKSLVFMNARLAGTDGPTVNSVDMTKDGQLIYHTSMEGTADPDDNSANPTSWTLSQASGAQKGRSITITKGSDGYLKLIDSLTGDIPINLVNDEAEKDGARVGETYKGTLQNATTDVDYVVTADYFTRTSDDGTVARIPRYSVEVTNSYPSTNTDVYQIYIDGSNQDDKVWIEDDMKYTGLFRLDVSDSLRTKLSQANDSKAVIEWHRLTADDENKAKIPQDVTSSPVSVNGVTDETVYRKISGEHWNLALNPNERTWLDIEADEGTDVWKAGTTRAYYAKLTYTPRGSDGTPAATPVTLYTTPLTVNYYGQLENGSFEKPKVTGHNTGNTSTGFSGGQTSNEWYKSAGGIWQTTGPGSSRAQSYAGRDIEIVDATNHNTLNNSYHWQNGDNSESSWAADGNQFAELNAENAGALYQDVITHPNEKINYWLSHRARGSGESDRQQYYYDTMYVVIMPTKLAMTMGDNGTELRTQKELQDFINRHGGFDSSVPVGHKDDSLNNSTMTYYDEDAGIMIYKIRSSEFSWHDVAVNSQYTAKGGLTRFFFAAASTAGDKARNETQPGHENDPPTMGNFIDNVGFNQQLPPTKGFNLTVTETFSGITMEQLAGLATNAKNSDYNGKNGITAQDNPLQVTLTNTRTTQTTTGSGVNDALSGAKLGFTMSYDNDKNLVLTPTATASDGKTNLLSSEVTKPGSGDVHQYPDGRIVIIWKFPDQDLYESNHGTSDQTYKYTANDNLEGNSTTNISGLTKTTSQNAVNNKNNELEKTTGASAGNINSEVSTGADKNLNIVNVYSPNVHISVRKTFTGVTPTTVREMMNGTGKSAGKQYAITITKENSSGDKADDTKVLKVDGGYDKNNEKDSSVTVSSSQGSDGSTTYTWNITDPDWQDATYHVKEENYTTSRNTLSQVTVNGEEVGLDENGAWPSTDPKVTIDQKTTAVMTFKVTSNDKDVPKDLSPSGGKLPETTMTAGTNLVVGQYTLKTTEGEGETATTKNTTKYVVWTSDDAGLTTRRAIIEKINNIWGGTISGVDQATPDNTTFYSGSDVYVVQDGRTARMVHQQSASLDGLGPGDTWDNFYAAHMTADSNGSSVDESEIRVNNEYTPKIKIQKQSVETTNNDGNETHERLNGAVFRLYKKDGTSKLYYQNSDNDQWTDDENNAKKFTTEDDTSTGEENLGKGIAKLATLPVNERDANYYLEEYKPPDGYQKIADIEFKIKTSGVVTLVENGDEKTVNSDKTVAVSFIDPYYTFIINDTPGEALPNTGGTGIALFIIIGAIIAICATAAIAKRRKDLQKEA